jgi:hypothetical protein
MTALHMSGRCHCVSVEAVGVGTHVSRARVAAAWRRTRLALALYAPLSPAHLSALEFSPSFLYQTPSLSFLFSLVCRSHASLASEPHPILSPLSPLKARVGGVHHGDVVPHLLFHW